MTCTALVISGPTGPAGPTGASGSAGSTGATGPTGAAAGGLQVRAGTVVLSGDTTVTFDTAFPTACSAVVLTGANGQPIPDVFTISFNASGFVANAGGSFGSPPTASYVAAGH